ncbi:MAG: nicotinamide-nucleotide amidohydrolase family protein [Rectinemataceae bacterium]
MARVENAGINHACGDANDAAARVSDAADQLFRVLSDRGLRVVCAESCTGGMVTAAITDIPGSSAVLWGGVVAYSNECKFRLLGVPQETIVEFGAVSREVAKAMAAGALAASGGADLALAITGIAGPEGGSAGKPIGLVWFAFRRADGGASEESAIFSGDRKAVREAAAERAMIRAAALARELRS